MKHLFIPYELAVIAKEKGFKAECLAAYVDKQLYINSPTCMINWWEVDCIAPLYQQIVDWFREKHNLVVSVDYNFINEGSKCWNRGHATGFVYSFKNRAFGAEYYEALNKAIEQAFKLI